MTRVRTTLGLWYTAARQWWAAHVTDPRRIALAAGAVLCTLAAGIIATSWDIASGLVGVLAGFGLAHASEAFFRAVWDSTRPATVTERQVCARAEQVVTKALGHARPRGVER